MRDYKIEDAKQDTYKNGVYVFRQDIPPSGVGAFAHIHSAIEILYITHGTLSVGIDDCTYNVFAGDVILFRSNTIHHILVGTEKTSRYYVIKIRPEIIFDIASEENQGSYALSFAVNNINSKCLWTKDEISAIPSMKHGLDMLVQLADNPGGQEDLTAKLGAGLVLMGMLSGAIESHGTDNAVNSEVAEGVYRAMSHINRHYKEDITEYQMCRLAGMSYSYFSRSFKAITGKTFKEYLNTTRINRAERMLITTDKSVTQICAECGFNNAAYFVKVFKKYKSLPPMEYKRKEKYYEYTKSEKI